MRNGVCDFKAHCQKSRYRSRVQGFMRRPRATVKGTSFRNKMVPMTPNVDMSATNHCANTDITDSGFYPGKDLRFRVPSEKPSACVSPLPSAQRYAISSTQTSQRKTRARQQYRRTCPFPLQQPALLSMRPATLWKTSEMAPLWSRRGSIKPFSSSRPRV